MAYTRRNIVKGLTLGAGLPVLAPILAQLEREAAGATVEGPKRFVFVAVSSGIMPNEVEPPAFKDKSKDEYFNVALDQYELEPAMKPFEPLKDYLSVIQGLSGKMCSGGHTGNYGALGVWRAPGEGGAPPPKRATVDHMLSKLFPAAVNHLTTGYAGKWGSRTFEGVVYPDISAAGPQKTIPFQASPDIVFEQLFGTVASKDRYSAKKLVCKKNLLDFMTEDVTKLQKALPTQEKAKLDHYLDALEGLQDQDVKIAALRESLEKNVPEFSDKYTSTEAERRQEAHFDLIAAALISGITNVVTMKIDNSATFYRGLGITEKSVHGIGHNESSNGKTGFECRDVIRRHHFELIAHLADKLKRVPEGEGNMLDNTMIVYISPAGDRHHGKLDSWPMVILGGCGKRLKLPGRYLQFPGYGQKDHKTIGNWWTSVLNAYGNPIKHYGDFDPALMKGGFDQEGPIPEIIA
ncbi:MAG: DUF1552 domain-containing protein [Phycisphaera sp.]|nr:DUF1552 domain-containing protein [Phycisphaera sp.]